MRERGSATRNEWLFALCVLAACVFAFGLTLRFTSRTSSAADRPLAATPSSVELQALARQATLRIATNDCGVLTIGSGFVIDGALVTNAHLVGTATEIKADQPIDPVLVDVIVVAAGVDLAVADAPPAVGLVVAPERAEPGDNVVIAGHADGGAIEVQAGTVVSQVDGAAYGLDGQLLLIEAQTRGGYSGGPVLDLDGNVVGVLSGFDLATGLTIAIAAEELSDVLAESRLRPAPAEAPGGGCPVG